MRLLMVPGPDGVLISALPPTVMEPVCVPPVVSEITGPIPSAPQMPPGFTTYGTTSAVQTPLRQPWPAGHAAHPPPQCRRSSVMSTHQPPQLVSPTPQVATHLPFEHAGV